MVTDTENRPDTILRHADDYMALSKTAANRPQTTPHGIHHWIWGQMHVLADAVTAGTDPQ